MKVPIPFNQNIFKLLRLFVVPVLIEHRGSSLYIPMIVDSGASYVTVRADIFDQLGIPALRRVPLVTASDRTAAPLGRADRVTVGSRCAAENVEIISTPLPQTLPAEGLLDASFLRHFPVYQDFEKGILEFDA